MAYVESIENHILIGVSIMSNQEAKADAGKPKLTLVPRQIIFDIAEVREYGTAKYHDPDNWKKVEKERYRDAAFRHFMKYLDDPDGIDEESGISHLKHLACNIAFLCELEKDLPSAQSEEFEWCHDCKEYDQDKHYCPRWTKVIRKTVEELKAQPETNCSEIPNGSDAISRQSVIDAKQEFRNPNVVRSTEANGWNDCNSAWIDAINGTAVHTARCVRGDEE